MTDWSRALAEAFRNHVEIGGSSGSSGSCPKKRRKRNELRLKRSGTTPLGEVVPVVPRPSGVDIAGTTGTTPAEAVVPPARARKSADSLASEDAGTTGTTGTTENGIVSQVHLEGAEQQPAEGEDGSSALQAWSAGLATLDPADPLPGYSTRRWRQLIEDGHRFLETWDQAAIRLGWGTFDLFGVHAQAPATRFDVIGLVPLIRGGAVTDLVERRATILMPSGSQLTYLKRRNRGAVAVWAARTRRPG